MERHAFERRGVTVQLALYYATQTGPANWDLLKAAGTMAGIQFETVRRAIYDGVTFGVFYKTGGKSGDGVGPPMVHLTTLGERYFADLELRKIGEEGDDEPVEFCRHEDIVGLCQRCPEEDEENQGGGGQ